MAKTKISIGVRFIIFVSTLAAALTMLSSRQTVHIKDGYTFLPSYKNFNNGYSFKATYKNWNSFQFFIAVNFLGAAYNLLVIILPDGSRLWKMVVVLDMVITMILVASCAAALETYSLLKNGNIQASWQPICRFVPIFCAKVLGAIVTCICGLFTSTLLLFYSFHIIFNPLLIKSEDDN
ncbi:CASP-like protein 1C1 [Solanum dulcamara]|uniref:CASP-like protein 1C1 n=1 Tax=Solanum dulcamara TaxID=45834 RepID=UPI0024869268|nr:CASP-like protein 1C1 [Solanum dulcamara]